MPEKKLTPEEKRALEKEGKKNGLSEKEIKDVENLVAIAGGMSEPAKRTLIGVGAAVGASAVTAIALLGGKKAYDKYKGNVTMSKDKIYGQSSALSAAYDTIASQQAALNGKGNLVLHGDNNTTIPIPAGVTGFSVEPVQPVVTPEGYDPGV